MCDMIRQAHNSKPNIYCLRQEEWRQTRLPYLVIIVIGKPVGRKKNMIDIDQHDMEKLNDLLVQEVLFEPFYGKRGQYMAQLKNTSVRAGNNVLKLVVIGEYSTFHDEQYYVQTK